MRKKPVCTSSTTQSIQFVVYFYNYAVPIAEEYICKFIYLLLELIQLFKNMLNLNGYKDGNDGARLHFQTRRGRVGSDLWCHLRGGHCFVEPADIFILAFVFNYCRFLCPGRRCMPQKDTVVG